MASAAANPFGRSITIDDVRENFAFFDPWQKLLMVLLMLLGRLEFFAVLALLQPQFWRR